MISCNDRGRLLAISGSSSHNVAVNCRRALDAVNDSDAKLFLNRAIEHCIHEDVAQAAVLVQIRGAL